jgi:hypothetical protein
MSDEYTVERILQSKGAGKAKRFLVKWRGYDDEDDNTWEPAANLHPELIADFESGASTKASAATKASPGAAKKNASPSTAAAGKRKAPPEEKEPPSMESICAELGSMDAAGLKSFVSALSKEGFGEKTGWGRSGFLKASVKKDQLVADLIVVVRATYENLCLAYVDPYGAWNQSGLKQANFHGRDAAPPKYSTERVRSVAWEDLGWPHYEVFNKLAPAKRIDKLEAAWARVCAGAASKKQRASLGPEGKQLTARLEVLDKAQLVNVLVGLVADEALSTEQIIAKLPAADLQPVIDECQRLVNVVGRHLPNSRYGSDTDAYGYTRCAAANNAAARAFKQAATGYKKAGNWQVAAEFCEKALPIARGMIDWDNAEHNAAKKSVVDVLTTLQAEAAAKLP